MRKLNIAFSAATLATSVPATALESWDSQGSRAGEAGYVPTTGNTYTNNLLAKLGVTSPRDKWPHTLALEALNTSVASPMNGLQRCSS